MLPAEQARTARETWFPNGTAAAGTPLVCLPYAGGTASVYRNWAAGLEGAADVVPVQLPGRGLRLGEEPYTALEPLVDDLAGILAETLSGDGRAGDRAPGDYALFGHSMGALLAYELACALRERGLGEPRHLFVSASRAPHAYGERSDHTLPDEELRRLITDLGGLQADDSVAAAYFDRRLPVLRADLRMCDEYRWRPRAPLSCPTTAFSASGDGIASQGQVDAWRAHTSGSFLRRHSPGGHFFLNDEPYRTSLLRTVRRELSRPTARPPAAATAATATAAAAATAAVTAEPVRT